MRKFSILMMAFVMVLAFSGVTFAQEADHGAETPVWMLIPFVIMLLSIAIVPLKWEHWWEDNNNKLKIAMGLGLPVGIAYAFMDYHRLLHSLEEYVAFIIYVGSLFVISGGVMIRGDFKCTAKTNLAVLTIGTLLASFIGTPGASMLLIRPLLRINKDRKDIKHVVIFFIFCVSNIGGLLTPLGDPPLFLGYLNGVPFEWTFILWPQWLVANTMILTIFYFFDVKEFGKNPVQDTPAGKPFELDGLINFVWLGGVVLSVAFVPQFGVREAIMCAMVGLSLKTTSKALRDENKFTYHPVIEVAYLFIGIFLTMIPALAYLELQGASLEAAGLAEPRIFLWLTGMLSAFLDNAPTYLTFFTLAKTMAFEPPVVEVLNGAIGELMLKAISVGAVFFGALSYIGNGPNFMVKAIADETGIKMPSFFGYMKWSFAILIPVFVVITYLFY